MWRAASLQAGPLFAPISREGALVVNNLLLSAATAAKLPRSTPLLLELDQRRENLGRAAVLQPHVRAADDARSPLLVPIGPMLSWKRAEPWLVVQRLWWAALVAVAVALAFLVAYQRRALWLAPVLVAVGAWIIAPGRSR